MVEESSKTEMEGQGRFIRQEVGNKKAGTDDNRQHGKEEEALFH